MRSQVLSLELPAPCPVVQHLLLSWLPYPAQAAEKAKCELSSTMSTDINLPFITADARLAGAQGTHAFKMGCNIHMANLIYYVYH